MLEVADDFTQAEHAHRHHHEVDAIGQLRHVEGVAWRAGIDVGADQAQQQAEHDHADRFQQRTMRQHHRGDQTQHHQREIFGRAEAQRQFG